MRDDAGSDPSARDAARGVIGLSAFANNRKGDARSADTCASARNDDDPASSVSNHTNETKKIFTDSPPRPRSANPFADVAARDVENPPPIVIVANKQTSKNARENETREPSVCLLVVARTSSVGRAGRSGVFASASSFVASVRSAVASASAVAARRVARRRPDILARRTREPSFRAVRPPARPFPSVRAFSDCPNDDVKKKNASRTFDT